MSRQIGDKYEETTMRDVNGEMVECMAEFEVVTINIVTHEDRTTSTIENSELVRYLD